MYVCMHGVTKRQDKAFIIYGHMDDKSMDFYCLEWYSVLWLTFPRLLFKIDWKDLWHVTVCDPC